MKRVQDKWMPIDDFLKEAKITMNTIYNRVKRRQWRDGYVVKKSPTGQYILGSMEDYHRWAGTIK